ncbi:MAG: beta-N-acetylhexosaminidase [Bacteroides sp.]|nr:beta-N-acetylhexosaminidase [Bacteroides sp.]MCM1447300.1 beta-N-acetylhexosaminidase [Bacteroides sp.]
MKKLHVILCFLLIGSLFAKADVITTEYTVATLGCRLTSEVSDGIYIISGVDQSNREFYLYDNGGQVKGSSTYPVDSKSTASFLWSLTAKGSEWIFMNVGTGDIMNLGGSNGSAVKTSATEQTNAVHFDANGFITILNANGQAIDMTANGVNPTTWTGTTTPSGSRRLKIYVAEDIEQKQDKMLSLVPAPKSVMMGDGEVTLKDGFTIAVTFADADRRQSVLADVARFMTTVDEATGLVPRLVDGKADITILENTGLATEGYVLDITSTGVAIEASTSDGVFYAMQSLLRLLPPNVILGKKAEGEQTYVLPVVRVEDEPRFSYRGFMLDVSRHFFTIREIKKMIDLMAIYKMNVFHWHLTDDQGWRAEIKRYPKLTTIGAKRNSSYDTPIRKIIENGQEYWTGEGAQTGKQYGPFFYTQAEMKEVVAYAAERHIDVLPEVDMPGHFVAALAAYPEYSCNPNSTPEVWTNGGISATVLNVANPRAVEFAKNIITELAEIFPYPYFHIGGDECPTSQWENNADCQKKLNELGKTSYRALQTEFIREINQHLFTLGKKMFCWNESITESGADLDLMKESGATIMCWNPCQSGAAKAAQLGLNAVITEWGSGCYYINRKQSNDYGEPGAAGSGNDNVAVTYNYQPVPAGVSASASKYYIGVQATFWTEHVSSDEYLEYLALPRFMCVAEAGWTPQEQKDWTGFVRRMTVETQMLSCGDYVFARHWMKDYVPRQAPASDISDGSVVSLTNKSTDRGRCMADISGTLNAQGTECTPWVLEQASADDNTYYIKSNVSGKYLYAANGNSGTQVTLNSLNKTAWAFDTGTFLGNVAICYANVTGNAINNNVSNTTKARLFAHGSGNGASFWIMEPFEGRDKLADGESGVLAYHYTYRGLCLLRREFILEKGTAYPVCEDYIPEGYKLASAPSVSGSVSLKSERLEIPVVPAPETGIADIKPVPTLNAIYNLNGQRLSSPQSGINIINGKKVVVR